MAITLWYALEGTAQSAITHVASVACGQSAKRLACYLAAHGRTGSQLSLLCVDLLTSGSHGVKGRGVGFRLHISNAVRLFAVSA